MITKLVSLLLGLSLFHSAVATSLISPDSLPNQWLFSGIVVNENGELFDYVFQLYREGQQLYTQTLLIEEKSNALLIHEQNSALFQNNKLYHWKIGKSFMEFNPINNSWVFGVKTLDKTGFNFRVDVLEANNKPILPHWPIVLESSNRLNGHIKIHGKEQFVTGQHSWFRQDWSNNWPMNNQFSVLTCGLTDNSRFYIATLNDAQKILLTKAVWWDEQDRLIPISQFVYINRKKTDDWEVSIPFPKQKFSLRIDNRVDKHKLIVGRLQGIGLGFCVQA